MTNSWNLSGTVVLTDQAIYFTLYTFKFMTIYGKNKVKWILFTCEMLFLSSANWTDRLFV